MSPLHLIQEDCYGRLLAEPALLSVSMLLQRRAVTEVEVKKMLSVQSARNGKAGACVIIEMPILAIADPNSAGPRANIIQAFTVLEHPTINASSVGTGMDAEQIAVAVLQLFHFYAAEGITTAFFGEGPTIVPENSIDGLVGYRVIMRTRILLEPVVKAVFPTIAAAAVGRTQRITLTATTPGSAIYYTLDGSYPTPGGAAAHLYSAPFVISAPCTLRAACSGSGLQQSNVVQADITMSS